MRSLYLSEAALMHVSPRRSPSTGRGVAGIVNDKRSDGRSETSGGRLSAAPNTHRGVT
jgi:hypothetical protein